MFVVDRQRLSALEWRQNANLDARLFLYYGKIPKGVTNDLLKSLDALLFDCMV